MLIHLCPSVFAHAIDGEIRLLDVSSDDLGVSLRGGIELAARRPFPNKRYLVACRNIDQKALCGFLVEAPTWLWSFTVVTRWEVESIGHVLTHRVRYEVMDNTHDAVSEQMMLWCGYQEDGGILRENRVPNEYGAPVTEQPRMELVPRLDRTARVRDVLNRHGHIVARTETFRIPSIERERITGRGTIWDRMPLPGSAFVVGNPVSVARVSVLGGVAESVELR